MKRVTILSMLGLFYLWKIRKNLHSKSSDLRKMQNRELRAMLQYAYENVPFYHRKFVEGQIRPDDIKTVEDLVKVPFTTKKEIQDASPADLLARNVDQKKCLTRRTSGSTGLPLTLMYDNRTVAFERAFWFRSYFENGLRISDNMAMIIDPPFFQVSQYWYQRLGILERHYLSIFDPPEKHIECLKQISPDAIQSYPSTLAILAEKCGKKSIEPRLIFTLSELLDKGTRQLINSTFETELFDLYGCTELGLMAWECRGRIGYHINSDGMIVEAVRDNGDSISDERGEIVCTSLFRQEMPLIRYKIGDVGTIANEECSCGVTLPLMEIVEGRRDDFLTTVNERILPPTIFFPFPFVRSEGLKQMKVVQERKDFLRIQLVIGETFDQSEKAFESAQMEIEKVFGKGTKVSFQVLDTIPRDSSGKLRKVVSNVPVKLL